MMFLDEGSDTKTDIGLTQSEALFVRKVCQMQVSTLTRTCFRIDKDTLE